MRRALKVLAQFPIRVYRVTISPLIGPCCRYQPSCSAYALQAVERHGVLKGIGLTFHRILRCHPFTRGHRHDPVPEAFAWGDMFGYKRTSSTTGGIGTGQDGVS